MWGLGMRLVVAWEWDYVGPGNETKDILATMMVCVTHQ